MFVDITPSAIARMEGGDLALHCSALPCMGWGDTYISYSGVILIILGLDIRPCPWSMDYTYGLVPWYFFFLVFSSSFESILVQGILCPTRLRLFTWIFYYSWSVSIDLGVFLTLGY